MDTKFERLSSNKVKIDFTVEPEKFEEGIKAAYKKNVKRINVPGFRRGKAPMKIIENYYGAGIFYEDAFEIIFPEIYQQAIKEYEIEVVDRPELNMDQIERGKELKFSVEVFVRPEVTLGEYKGLGIEKTVDEVTDDDVNAEIERARERAARFVEVTDRPAKLDDQVNIDYAGFDGDEQFDGGTAKGYELVLGSGQFIPGFEDQLVGATVGQDVEVKVTFPEEYHNADLAGKPVVFKVKVNAIHEKEVPAIDDDFVTEVSENANTVDEYKVEIRERLEKQAAEKAEQAFEQEVIEAVVANVQVDIPQAMIEDQIDSMVREMEFRMRYQGLNMDDFLKYSGQTMEGLRGMYKEQAIERVKAQLTLDAIRKAENIVADEADIDAEIAKLLEGSDKTVEEYKEKMSDGDREYYVEVASLNKTVKFLKDNAGKAE